MSVLAAEEAGSHPAQYRGQYYLGGGGVVIIAIV